MKNFPAVFHRWHTIKNEIGSSVDLIINNNDVIDGKSYTSYAMSGSLSDAGNWRRAGVIYYPAPHTLEAMKTMTSLSFKVLGDSNSYLVLIETTDTLKNKRNEDNYYIMFPTVKEQISTIIKIYNPKGEKKGTNSGGKQDWYAVTTYQTVYSWRGFNTPPLAAVIKVLNPRPIPYENKNPVACGEVFDLYRSGVAGNYAVQNRQDE